MRRSNRLKVGDKIRIVSVPGEGVDGYYIHHDTRRVYKKIIARRRPVRICEVDGYGTPWYICKFRLKDGRWEKHYLSVSADEANWVRVQPRNV
jgi:hypothetical protein